MRCFVLTLAIVLTSCGNLEFASEQNYRNELQKYIGMNISNVVEVFGHADNLSESPEGNRLFVYSNYHTSTTPITCNKDAYGNDVCSGGNSVSAV